MDLTIEQQCVARGEALLDQKAPGWDRDIDLPSLDLQSCSRCVVGQWAGTHGGSATAEYSAGLRRLGLTSHAEASEYGFNLHPEVLEPFEHLAGKSWYRVCDAAWERLTEAWRERIAQRRLALMPELLWTVPELAMV